jgi:RND family efflux transporter MFP subunit
MTIVEDRHPQDPRGRHGAHAAHGAHGRAVTLVGVTLVVVSALLVALIAVLRQASHRRQAEALAKQIDRGPVVEVVKATASPSSRELDLPADVRGYFQSTLYAKVSGYVRTMRVDKGDRVKTGQVLGTIESPETDQAVLAARADLANRKQLVARARALAPDVVAEQDRETAESNFISSNAGLAGALAIKDYEIIRAPFDGVITTRYVDPGALLPAATSATQSAQPLVDIADTDRLRVTAFVGQDSAAFVAPGVDVTLWQDLHPENKVHAKVTRTSGSLDPRTRTMLSEIDLDNRGLGFITGTFTHAVFKLDTPPLPVIPAEGLLIRAGNPFVPVVEHDHIHMAPVVVGVSDGRTMQIVSGLKGTETVALNLPAELDEGSPVQPQERPGGPAGGANPATPPGH